MSSQEARKLLGGYATGTLTPEEMRALFEAALEDQDLFDALQREQPLREVLHDAPYRRQVLAELERTSALARPVARWTWYRWALAAGMLAALVAMVILVRKPPHAVVSARKVAMPSPAPVLRQPAPATVAERAALPPPAPQRKSAKKHQREAVQIARSQAAAPPPPAAGPPAPAPMAAAAPAAIPQTPAGVAQTLELSSEAITVLPQPVQYTLLRRNDAGQFVDTTTPAIVHAGDGIRIRVQAIRSGRVSLVVNTGASTTERGPSGDLAVGAPYVLPADGEITAQPGMTLALRFVPAEPAAGDSVSGARFAVPGVKRKVAKASANAVTIPVPLTVE